MNTSEVLNKAADLIEERGWTTGVGWTDLLTTNSPICVQGAIAAAMGVESAVGYRCSAWYAVADYLGISQGLFCWNDALTFVAGNPMRGWVGGSPEAAHEYGKTTVIATLRAAAVIEAAKENDSRADLAAVGVAVTGEAVR